MSNAVSKTDTDEQQAREYERDAQDDADMQPVSRYDERRGK